jgi:hypothetical protein
MDVEARLDALERRVRALEDEREIRALIGRYGARADGGDHEGFVDLFSADGAMTLVGGAPGTDRSDDLRWEGRDGLRQFIDEPTMHMAIEGRSLHASGLGLRAHIDGDDAVALSCSLVVVAEADGLRVHGGGFERWTLRRHDGAWRILERRRAAIGADAVPALVTDP